MGIESNQGTPEFDEFVASGDVEVGASNLAEDEGEKEEKPAKRGPPKVKPAVAAEGDDDAGNQEGDDEGGEEGNDDADKPRKSAKDHQIERLKREKAEIRRELREARAGGNPDLVRRLENIEKGLSGGNSGDNQNAGKLAPDPTDSDKYPLGHLDDRYVEDKLEWLANKKATELADSALQRQQEGERNQAVTRHQEALLEKVDDLAAKGSDQFEDFQELVVDAGIRGDYDLSEATFEAACEADNGPQILYDLSQDPKEAKRVAKLSPYGQMKYVQERDAEIGTGKKGRTKPQAGEPPKNLPRGANSKTQINPATDKLDDFAKAWEQDAKKNSH